jgi:hypothetical protein
MLLVKQWGPGIPPMVVRSGAVSLCRGAPQSMSGSLCLAGFVIRVESAVWVPDTRTDANG